MIEQLIGPTLPCSIPEVRAIAVVTVDGQTAVNGTSQSMGSATDAALLQGLRQWADAVVVGAGTVRSENYGGVINTPEQQQERLASGQQPVARIAVLSRSLDIDTSSRLFTETTVAPLILTSNPDAKLRSRLTDAGAEVHSVTSGDFLARLRKLGYRRIVVEGGPSVYAQLLARDDIDLLHLTIDPSLAMMPTTPLLSIAGTPAAKQLLLENCTHDEDGCVFLRYRLRPASSVGNQCTGPD